MLANVLQRVAHQPGPACALLRGTLRRRIGDDVTEMPEYAPKADWKVNAVS
jgi:hypothetical protein